MFNYFGAVQAMPPLDTAEEHWDLLEDSKEGLEDEVFSFQPGQAHERPASGKTDDVASGPRRVMADDCLLEAVRRLHLAHPELGPKPLLAKLQQQQPDLAAGNKEVREALATLKAEEELKQRPAAQKAAAEEDGAVRRSPNPGAPSPL